MSDSEDGEGPRRERVPGGEQVANGEQVGAAGELVAAEELAGSEEDEGAEIDGDEEVDAADVLVELLEEIAQALGLDVRVVVDEADGVLSGRIEGEDVGLFIGKHGQTINAVQHLAQRIVFPGGPSPVRVTIDADGYRERRAELLREDADDAADEALRSGRAVELDPMPPSERRIVHEYLRERGHVETHSEGEEPERYLVVSPVDD